MNLQRPATQQDTDLLERKFDPILTRAALLLFPEGRSPVFIAGHGQTV